MIAWGGYNGFIQLRGQKKKVGGMNTVRLNWKGATSLSIDVYRDDVLIATTANAPPFLYTDFTGDTGPRSIHISSV